ncbi:unnamed protein product [Didymodactylos carnosus]|uniref:Uncharacterized protein n=1 Tax=Didymodactylos carnosus TaxID=1234261 RepID=A0A814CRH5_9BILA|nr:unnamed protein product [Didymodactylos carnosus]CAF1491768.1 unnamed protein product [Didymodactylos carnosus]CAF3722010.1 unnamed protein product [Didymodactylos carnosus]CAF4280919.1 unnamed protein product [Didymodactylos carnosus]
MRTERNSHGSKIFTPDRYLTENQVKNQFKQLHSKNKKSKSTMHIDMKHSSPDRAKRTFARATTRSRKAISNADIADEDDGHGNIPIKRKAKLPASHSILDNFDEDDDMLLSDIKNTFQKMTPLVPQTLITHTNVTTENNDKLDNMSLFERRKHFSAKTQLYAADSDIDVEDIRAVEPQDYI